MESSVKYDMDDLQRFARQITEEWVVKIGIFGSKTGRTNVGAFSPKLGHRKPGKEKVALTNAEVGFIHEYGSASRNIPPRSFLRMPLTLKAKEIMRDAKVGALPLIYAGNVKGLMDRLGAAALKWVQLAFATRGFGHWPADRPKTVKRKHSAEPLIDTGQLRRAVAYKVDRP